MTDRMQKLMALDSEIDKLLKENEEEERAERERYETEITDAYLHMAESLRPYHDIYVKTARMQSYPRCRIRLNDEGWYLCFSPYLGFVVGDEPHNTIVADCVASGGYVNKYSYKDADGVIKGYGMKEDFKRLLRNWDEWFPIFEANFIDSYHEARTLDIEIANKNLEWRKSLTL